MKVCYCLVSSGVDHFADMLCISYQTLRAMHPGADVVVLLDADTARMVGNVPRIGRVLDRVQWVTVEATCRSASIRSRVLKTAMRRLVSGRFIYLDIDALVVRKLDGLWEAAGDVAAAYDRNRGVPAHNCSASWVGPLYHEMGWRFPPKRYFNSGVVVFDESEGAYRVGDRWGELWSAQVSQTGEHRDQPSFNAAIDQVDARVSVLPLRFNAVVDAAPCFERDAAVLHFYSRGAGPRPGSLLYRLLEVYRRDEVVDWGAIRAATVDRWSSIPRACTWDPSWAPPAEQYRQWGRRAVQLGDHEAASRFAAECVRREPWSLESWKVAAKTLLMRSRDGQEMPCRVY